METACGICQGTGTVRAFSEQGTACPACGGRGAVTVPDPTVAPPTIDDAIAAEIPSADAASLEPGESPKVQEDTAVGEDAVPAGKILTLVAFDIDGTLDTSGGPVPWEKVKTEAAIAGRVALGIVSPSGARPKDDTPAYLPGGGGDRIANLRTFADAYPDATARIYVSDNNDQVAAVVTGFTYIDCAEYAARFA